MSSDAEEPLRIWWNKNLHHKISPMKLAAHAAHAALKAYGVEYTHPIVVLSAGKAKIEAMPITIHDAGKTELAPGTLTTGVERPWRESSAEYEYGAETRVNGDVIILLARTQAEATASAEIEGEGNEVTPLGRRRKAGPWDGEVS